MAGGEVQKFRPVAQRRERPESAGEEEEEGVCCGGGGVGRPPPSTARGNCEDRGQREQRTRATRAVGESTAGQPPRVRSQVPHRPLPSSGRCGDFSGQEESRWVSLHDSPRVPNTRLTNYFTATSIDFL